MHTNEILNLMEYWRHCHECGALLVTAPGGAICPHCGFELEEPEEGAVVGQGWYQANFSTAWQTCAKEGNGYGRQTAAT